MSMDRIWQRRSNNTGRPSVSSGQTGNSDLKIDPPKAFSSTRRGADTPGGKGVGFATTPGANTPTAGGASSAFGLGSGAFASFGASSKAKPSGAPEALEKTDRDAIKPEDVLTSKQSSSSLNRSVPPVPSTDHPIKASWVVWYRPPTSKNSDYEKSTIPLASFATVEQFWTVYTHLKRPSGLPAVSDYHIFKKGVRPVWEDEENKKGGKWIVRLRKGVADRYWEDLLLGIVGDQFAEAGDEVCGAVLSVRTGEDVLSIWTKVDGGRNIRVRETVKRLLNFPADTNIQWKSHDSSIAQRSAIDQARQDKVGAVGVAGRRRDTLHDDSVPEKSRG